MKFQNVIFPVLISVLLLNIPASNALDGKALYSEKTCIACHGAEGKKPILPAYPKIAGQNKEYVIAQMADIKESKRTNGNSAAMQGVMHLVNTEEIAAIAEYLSKVKP